MIAESVVLPALGGFDIDGKVLLDLILSDVFGKGRRTQSALDGKILVLPVRRHKAVVNFKIAGLDHVFTSPG